LRWVAFRRAGLRGRFEPVSATWPQESTLCARLRGRRRVAARFFIWRRFWNHHETKPRCCEAPWFYGIPVVSIENGLQFC